MGVELRGAPGQIDGVGAGPVEEEELDPRGEGRELDPEQQQQSADAGGRPGEATQGRSLTAGGAVHELHSLARQEGDWQDAEGQEAAPVRGR